MLFLISNQTILLNSYLTQTSPLLQINFFCDIAFMLYPSEAILQRVYWNCMVVITLAIATIYCSISNLIIALIKRGVN